MELHLVQRSKVGFGGVQRIGVAEHAADPRVGSGARYARDYRAKQRLAPQRGSAERLARSLAGEEITRLGRRIESHEDSEIFDQRRDLAGIVTRGSPRGDDDVRVIFWSKVIRASGVGSFVGEKLI